MGFSRDNRSGSSELIFRGSNFLRFMSGLWVTVRISLPSVGLSVALGLIVGIVMTLKNPIARLVTRAYLEFVRTMPQLVLLFLVYFGLTRAFGWNLSVNVSAVVVFTVWGTAELPYMKVALGVVSPDSAVITSVEELSGKTLIVCKGATAETFFQENFTDVKLQKYDQYTDAYNALLDGRGGAFSTDNTGALAWALLNPGFTVGIESLGDLDTIAPAVQKGNITLLDWLNEEIVTLGAENFFHANYETTLAPVYGDAASPDSSWSRAAPWSGPGEKRPGGSASKTSLKGQCALRIPCKVVE